MLPADILQNSRSHVVRSMALGLGFLDCRFAKAEPLKREADFLNDWLAKGYHGKMKYMENYLDKRIDPRALVPGAKSVMVLSYNYYPESDIKTSGPKVSKYAYGADYHEVIRSKLKEFLGRLNTQFGVVQGRGFVDSAPVMEKAWAARSGVGWIGKHTNVISKKKGSYFFLAVLITDLALEPDEAVQDHCGQCTRCIDACPTHAIVEPYVLDASKCISYFTIELKDERLPEVMKGKFENWMFGCDICQDVCPWNRFSTPHCEPQFTPNEFLSSATEKDWEELTMQSFQILFPRSALRRAGFDAIQRNLKFIATS